MLSVIFALFILGLNNHATISEFIIRLSLLGMLFGALLLRQRVTDELKDNRHDARYYPGRPFQRGIISKNQLSVLGISALLTEFAAVYLLGGIYALGWYMPALVFSLLMAKEFFLKEWLDAHFTIYFMLHEAIFVFLGLWAIKLMNVPLNIFTLAWTLAFICAMMCIEVVRKFEIRKDTMGRVVMDSYTAVWGESATRSLLELFVMVSGVALAYAESSIAVAVAAALTALVLNLLRPQRMMLQATAAIYLLTVSVFGVVR